MGFALVPFGLLGSVLPLAIGLHLRDPLDFTTPPRVDTEKLEIQTSTVATKLSALRVRSSNAANTAQAAAAQAVADKLKAEEIWMNIAYVKPELDAIQNRTQLHATQAAESAVTSQEAVANMTEQLKNVTEGSKLLAVQEVKVMLKEKSKALSEWRHSVLSNPWQRGQEAAAKAALPYSKMMGQFGQAMGAFGMEAQSMRSQATADAANAAELRSGVDAKNKVGDVIEAAQDYTMADALSTQSRQLSERASTLDAQISTMQGQLPAYSSAAHMASWNAVYAANPDGIPPPPVDPNFAFSPPHIDTTTEQA
jgi:hypothetical protein